MSKVGAILYGVVSFTALLLMLTGTPLDQFRPRTNPFFLTDPCVTLWGGKMHCSSTEYVISGNDVIHECYAVLELFRVAEASSIVSIALLLAATILGVLSHIYNKSLRTLTNVLLVCSMVTVGVVWGLMVHVYKEEISNCIATPFRTHFKFGHGFGLIVASWSLTFFAVVFLNLPYGSRLQHSCEVGDQQMHVVR
ncbi:putative amastin [Trypanosoma cruzi]|uniref:Amastin, putative n=2 Tax=Trypanosoma cruzi TaxID=5693 RepID=Q4DU87_TRYCC|nr:amastin, putative [Trypanosoma cruzi]EAN96073.1 amastin, putative [Trypanosoma cruzi]PWV13637.1 putative amastin [Trypanosoma cruzi]RNC44758.1 amastin [Trypanosoma cruzi]|eukprot:XP_817924.1 amastin [Trypanosoma cruzi strain CL Brener]